MQASQRDLADYVYKWCMFSLVTGTSSCPPGQGYWHTLQETEMSCIISIIELGLYMCPRKLLRVCVLQMVYGGNWDAHSALRTGWIRVTALCHLIHLNRAKTAFFFCVSYRTIYVYVQMHLYAFLRIIFDVIYDHWLVLSKFQVFSRYFGMAPLPTQLFSRITGIATVTATTTAATASLRRLWSSQLAQPLKQFGGAASAASCVLRPANWKKWIVVI